MLDQLFGLESSPDALERSVDLKKVFEPDKFGLPLLDEVDGRTAVNVDKSEDLGEIYLQRGLST